MGLSINLSRIYFFISIQRRITSSIYLTARKDVLSETFYALVGSGTGIIHDKI